jgi:hypothetical protein
MNGKTNSPPNRSEENDVWIEAVRKQVESLRFGVVQIVVHDSRVVTIERTEKIRVSQARSD